jgi:hypothetical protein
LTCFDRTTEKLALLVGVGVVGLSCAFAVAAPAKGTFNAPSHVTTDMAAVVGSSGAALKTVRRILPSPGRHWVGDAFHVFPVFHDLAFTKELSPWLMFDYAAPKVFSPTTKRRGVGQHPHRGFETITLAFQGEVEHGDSVGNRGVIGPGDVQWMTAARGIIHEEFHSVEFRYRPPGVTFRTSFMCSIA